MSISAITFLADQLIPKSCHLKTGEVSAYQKELSKEELRNIEKSNKYRIREFKAGRSLAKEAAKNFGVNISSLPTSFYGYPIWPEKIVGSISHKVGFCGVLMASSEVFTSIGFDIELVESLDKAVWKVFSLDEEIEQAKDCNMERSFFANSIFSAKEAYFKCLSPIYLTDTPPLDRKSVV